MMMNWDKELFRAQARIDLGVTDDQLDEFLKKMRDWVVSFIRNVTELWEAIKRAFKNFADAAIGIAASFTQFPEVAQPVYGPFGAKSLWRGPRHPKRPRLFVAYNHVPAKRPLHGRRGRK